ncbi:hypothetical protein AQ505_17285 [Pedobacter sp. PACM 27299]|nr:hypothetical protein AQ505_17285 [Pedobacter sp. PACM 27299]
MEAIQNVLMIINEKGRLRVPKSFLIPIAGFARLRRAGYIRIQKENTEFYAYLTPKGLTYLQDHFITSKLVQEYLLKY